LIKGLAGWFAALSYLRWFLPPENRPHSALGMLSPAAYERALAARKEEAA